GLHDAVIAGCRRAGVIPRLAVTPSLIGTVMTYVEAGAGIGVVTELVGSMNTLLKFIPLRPTLTVPLVLVWRGDEETAPLRRFRELLFSWHARGNLWPTSNERSAASPSKQSRKTARINQRPGQSPLDLVKK